MFSSIKRRMIREKGFRLDRQMPGNQLLGHRQLELAVNGLLAHQLRQQIAHDPVGGVFFSDRVSISLTR